MSEIPKTPRRGGISLPRAKADPPYHGDRHHPDRRRDDDHRLFSILGLVIFSWWSHGDVGPGHAAGDIAECPEDTASTAGGRPSLALRLSSPSLALRAGRRSLALRPRPPGRGVRFPPRSPAGTSHWRRRRSSVGRCRASRGSRRARRRRRRPDAGSGRGPSRRRHARATSPAPRTSGSRSGGRPPARRRGSSPVPTDGRMSRSVMTPGPWASGSSTTAAPDVALAHRARRPPEAYGLALP